MKYFVAAIVFASLLAAAALFEGYALDAGTILPIVLASALVAWILRDRRYAGPVEIARHPHVAPTPLRTGAKVIRFRPPPLADRPEPRGNLVPPPFSR